MELFSVDIRQRQSLAKSKLCTSETGKFLLDCFGASSLGFTSFLLLYRATEHGFKVTDFHSRCDYKGPTLILVKNDQNLIFGGFTTGAWEAPANFLYKADHDGFIFSLSKKRRYMLGPGQSQYAICCYSNRGPVFGGGHDISISDNSNSNTTSYSDAGKTYIAQREELTGTRNFSCLEIEVFECI